MKKILVLVFGLLFGLIEAQPPTRFYTTFGGSGDDIGYSAKQTFDGQYIIVGSTTSFGSTDVYLLKVDSMGLLIWQKNLGGLNNDVGKSVVQMPDSGFVVAGFTNSFGAGGYDAFLLRTDKNGNTLWQKTFGGANWDFANDLVLTANNKIAVVGNTSSFGSGKKDGMVLLYDFAGNLIWQKFFGGVENEELRAIISTNDSNLATVGYTESKNDINGDGYFLKLNLSGDTLFTKTYGGKYKGYSHDVTQQTNGQYIIAGAETYSQNAFTQSQMYCMSMIGDSIWENHYTKTNGDEAFVSVCNSTQLSYLSAFVRSAPFASYNFQGEIFVATPGGWKYKINDVGGLNNDFFYSVESTTRGGFVIVGSTESFNSAAKDIFFVKHDSTCFYYSSIVNTNKISKKKTSYYSQQDRILTLNFLDEIIPNGVTITDIQGTLLLERKVDEAEFKLDLSSYTNGIYLLTFKYGDGNFFHQKVIIY
jgi:hypothetical protein